MYNKFTYPLPQNKHTTELLKVVREEAEKLYMCDIKSLPYSKFKLFEENGSRVEYEADYIEHRKMLCAFAGMVLAAENQDKWLPKLCDIIWAICDEYTWAFPAHLRNIETVDATITRIDLFAAETGMALAEISYILGDLIPLQVRDRVEYELKRRIIEPYVNSPSRFGVNNWSAVCGCGVGSIIIYLGLDMEFANVKDNLMQNMEDFLDSYLEDGCCLEGSLYWAYGFSFFCYFAELLRQYTHDEINFFENEKVKQIALFGPNMYLSENNVISFSDSPHTLKYDSGIWHLLAEKYAEIAIPNEIYQNLFGDDLRYRFAPFIRNFYWYHEKNLQKSKINVDCVFYGSAKWYINKKYGYAFSAKAGCNAEPHNHNDVGSFLFLANGKYILDDIGWPKYTKDYFTEGKRYLNMCASSLGHSVPIIDGEAQRCGEEFKSKVIEVNDNEFAFEMSDAYGIDSLTNLKRRFVLSANGITVKDSAEGNYKKFTERFMTRIKPVAKNGEVYIDDYILRCNISTQISILSFEFEPRFTCFAKDGSIETAYMIDFIFEDFTDAEFSLNRRI